MSKPFATWRLELSDHARASGAVTLSISNEEPESGHGIWVEVGFRRGRPEPLDDHNDYVLVSMDGARDAARLVDWLRASLVLAEAHLARAREVEGTRHRCRGCGEPLDPTRLRLADGCPCNSPRGVNHGLVPLLTCTCDVCDPARTGSTRYPPSADRAEGDVK